MATPTFQIGLCMAGAVSAGAYTAGVMDYLLEALEEWDQRKKSGSPNVPSHKVSIPVMGGASAGGMTTIITAAAINRVIEPAFIDPSGILKPQPQNPFYHTWVDLLQEDMFPMLLDTSDISKGKIYSLFNSSFINSIAQKTVTGNQGPWINRDYIDEHLKIFATLTNLEGFCRFIEQQGAASTVNRYAISRHNDYACFILNKDQNQYNGDGWIPLNFKNGTNVPIAIEAAMATGAFPVGLKARQISRGKNYLRDLKWLAEGIDTATIITDPYKALIVDGGIINNEPFDKVREVLTDITGQKNKEAIHDYDHFQSTVIMIDPFPTELEKFEADDHLLKVMGSTLSAMLGHLRIKPSDLIEAMNKECAGQYLIAPVRKIPQLCGGVKAVEGSKAIASGFFGGFGGFLHKEFRIHDFLLGRVNCEKFLLDHFTVPKDSNNPIFMEGYKDIDASPFTSQDGRLQIIPLFKPRKDPFPLIRFENGSDWPVRREKDIDRFKAVMKNRTQSILLNASRMNAFNTLLLWIGAKVILNRKITGTVLGTIKDSMREYGLLS